MGDISLKDIELLAKVSTVSECDQNICYHGLSMIPVVCRMKTYIHLETTNLS